MQISGLYSRARLFGEKYTLPEQVPRLETHSNMNLHLGRCVLENLLSRDASTFVRI